MKTTAQPVIRTTVNIPLDPWGVARFSTFHGLSDQREHFAIEMGSPGPTPLVRLHSECVTGDLFGSKRCDCGKQLDEALNILARDGGYLLYLRQEGRGIGLYSKIDAYRLQDGGIDTFEANRKLDLPEDGRNFKCAADMLRALGVSSIRLLSNNPDKAAQLTRYGIHIAEILPTTTFMNPDNAAYLRAKAARGHTLASEEGDIVHHQKY